MTDYAHTKTATNNRQHKANALALAASQLGFQVYDLAVVNSTVANENRRESARKTAGFPRRPSDETWSIALEVLLARGLESSNGVRCGRCSAPVRNVKTEGGAVVAIDPFASSAGNVVPAAKDGVVLAVVYAGHDTIPENAPRFRQHQNSCPASREGKAKRLREAPKCTVCNEALDPELAYTMGAQYSTHPCCDPYGGGERDRAPTPTRKIRSTTAK